MSTLTKKKAMLKQIQKQAEARKKMSNIPKIQLSKITNKTNDERIKSYDKLQLFLSKVLQITDDELVLPDSNSYDNNIIQDGYEYFLKDEVANKRRYAREQSEGADYDMIKQETVEEWKESYTFTKLLYILDAFSNKKDTDYSMKKFFTDIKINITSERALKKFIQDCLDSGEHYDYFLNNWLSGGKGEDTLLQQMEEEEKKVEQAVLTPEEEQRIAQILTSKTAKELNLTLEDVTYDVLEKRKRFIPFTDEEQKESENIIDDLNSNIDMLEKSFIRLEDKEHIRNETLNELSIEEIYQVVIPIVRYQPIEYIINNIINIEFTVMQKDKYKELFPKQSTPLLIDNDEDEDEDEETEVLPMHPSLDVIAVRKYEDFIKKLVGEKQKRIEELRSLSKENLLLEAVYHKSKQVLIKYVIFSEFYNKKQKIRKKLFNLKIKHTNILNRLKSGKYVIPSRDIKLKYNERMYKNSLLVHIRKLEIQTWSRDDLILHIDVLGVGNKVRRNFKEKHLIDIILSNEFTDQKDVENIQKLDRPSMKAVLLTLDEYQINILTYSYGINNPEERGKHRNIESILLAEYPTVKKQTKQLVYGKFSKNFQYMARKQKLEEMDFNDLKALAISYGFQTKRKNQDEIIEIILKNEENIAKIITKEELDKEELILKISSVTGQPKKRYLLWSLEELKQRLSGLGIENNEYWEELEKERLYKKLTKVVDIKLPPYSDANTWGLKKLRKNLEIIGGVNWETYKPLIEDYSFVNCMKKFSTYSWINGRVTGVWITTGSGEKPKDDYIIPDITIEVPSLQKESNTTWYQASKKFFALQCNQYKIKRTQEGVILTCYTQFGEKIDFIVGYTIIGYVSNKYKARTYMIEQNGKTVQRTFVIQDEIMFRNELLAERIDHQSEFMRIQDILDNPVTENVINFISKKLSTTLLEIAPLNTDYGITHITTTYLIKDGYKKIDFNTPYIQILIESMRTGQSQTTRELLEAVANIIIYLQIPEAKTFRRNIEIEYYLPNILATLSPSEKFPEVYEDPNASFEFIDQTTVSINNSIYKFINNMGESLFYLENQTRRKKNIPQSMVVTTKTIKTRDRISACENKNRVSDASPQEIVYYKDKDDSKIYCFTIDELWNQFINGDITNPDTGKQFDRLFVQRFNELYNKRLAEDGLLTNYFQKKYGFNMEKLAKEQEHKDIPEIAIDLLSIIGKDIAELEDQLSNEKPEDGDEIDEDREPEKREQDFKEHIRDSIEITMDDICEYCKKHLSDDSIKTLIRHDNESRIIKFCSFKCFEHKNDWQKYKDKKTIKVTKINTPKSISTKSTPTKTLTKKELKNILSNKWDENKYNITESNKKILPLLTKEQLKEFAKEKDINIPKLISNKKDIAVYILKELHSKSKIIDMSEKEAWIKKRLKEIKIEQKKEEPKKKGKDKKEEEKEEPKKKSKDKKEEENEEPKKKGKDKKEEPKKKSKDKKEEENEEPKKKSKHKKEEEKEEPKKKGKDKKEEENEEPKKKSKDKKEEEKEEPKKKSKDKKEEENEEPKKKSKHKKEEEKEEPKKKGKDKKEEPKKKSKDKKEK